MDLLFFDHEDHEVHEETLLYDLYGKINLRFKIQ